MHAPVVWLEGTKVTLQDGMETTVTLGRRLPTEVSRLKTNVLRRRIRFEKTDYRADELCGLLNRAAEPGPRFNLSPTLNEAMVNLPAREATLLEVLERIHTELYCFIYETDEDIVVQDRMFLSGIEWPHPTRKLDLEPEAGAENP